MKIDPPRLYWTSKATDFDKEIWYESSPGECGSLWFPYASQFLEQFPRIACRVFWLLIMTCKLIEAHPPVYPNLICMIEK